jgi:hypothetical protein
MPDKTPKALELADRLRRRRRIADARNPAVKSDYIYVDCSALFSAADHKEVVPAGEYLPLPVRFAYDDEGNELFSAAQLFNYVDADRAMRALPAPAQQEPYWEGAEEWEKLAWHLCAEENGEDSCNDLIWEGGPIPEPWGDRWLKYEGEARRMIALVRTHVPAPQPEAQEPVAWQSRTRPTWGANTSPWSPWEPCTKGQAEDYWKTPLLHDWAYEARALYTAPQAAPVAQGDAEDAARYRWLVDYLISDRYYLDDAIIARDSKQELDDVIDAARKQGGKT